MKIRCGKNRIYLFVICLIVLGLVSYNVEASTETKTTVLKIATLAPEGSSWVVALKQANRSIMEKTQGRVKIKFYPGGVLGDETVIIKKIRFGQIDGALMTSGGMGSIYSDIRVNEVPFLFDNYDEADYVLSKVGPFFQQELEKKGYTVLGWSEAGFIYLMSNKPLSRVNDIKGLKIWMWTDSDIPRVVFKEAGLSPVPLNVTDVLVALQTGLVDVVYNSPLGAISLQWFMKIKYITNLKLAYSFGGLVVTSKKFQKLQRSDQAIVRELMSARLNELKKKTRRDNQEALKIMQKEGVRIITPDPREVNEFRELADRAVSGMDERILSREILHRVQGLVKEYRNKAR